MAELVIKEEENTRVEEEKTPTMEKAKRKPAGWLEGFTGRPPAGSAGWLEGFGKRPQGSEGWVEGLAEKTLKSEGWTEGYGDKD